MISPSENNRNRGLMSSNEIVNIHILGCFEEEPPGFQEPGFGGLGTPRIPGDGWRWREISLTGIKNKWVELQLHLLLVVWWGMGRRCFPALWIKIMERIGNLRVDLGRNSWFCSPPSLQSEGEWSLSMVCKPWAGWIWANRNFESALDKHNYKMIQTWKSCWCLCVKN